MNVSGVLASHMSAYVTGQAILSGGMLLGEIKDKGVRMKDK
jgi:hypothetical protein